MSKEIYTHMEYCPAWRTDQLGFKGLIHERESGFVVFVTEKVPVVLNGQGGMAETVRVIAARALEGVSIERYSADPKYRELVQKMADSIFTPEELRSLGQD